MINFSGNIGLDILVINSFATLEKFCSYYTKNQIHVYFLSKNAYNLSHRDIGQNTPNTYSEIPDIRSVYGAGLRVLSGTCNNLSENTKFCAEIIISYIKKNGFKGYYSVIDGILAYQCLSLVKKIA